MSKHFKWARLWFLGFGVCLVGAQAETAATKGLTFSGSAEAGYAYTWDSTPSTKNSQWLVDSAVMNMTATLSDSTSVVISNAVSVVPVTTNALSGGINSANYFSRFQFTNNGFTLANNAAYIDHKLADGVHLWAGNFRVPFGMESTWARYDMHTYYYSMAFATAQGANWLYDVGVKLAVSDVIPGTLEVAVVDGRQNGATDSSPAQAVKYGIEIKGGDMSITPTVSAYLGRWIGGPKDLGFTVGANWKMGTIWTNVEWLYLSQDNAGVKTKNMSIYVEPGFDFGVANFSLKGEWYNQDPGAGTSTSDFNIGAALSHEYEGGYRIKLAYAHGGIKGDLGGHVNDIRLLLGAKF